MDNNIRIICNVMRAEEENEQNTKAVQEFESRIAESVTFNFLFPNIHSSQTDNFP